MYLAANIIFITVWALCYKLSIRRSGYFLGVIASTCGTATVAIFGWDLITLGFHYHQMPALMGIVAGVCLFFAMISYFLIIQSGARLGVSWTIITLSMIIPTFGSIIIWKELPNSHQAAGLLLALIAVPLLGQVKPGASSMTGREFGLLAASFFLSGGVSLITKAVPTLGYALYVKTYVFCLYAGGFAVAVIACLSAGRVPTGDEVKLGIIMGLAGAGNHVFLVLALEHVSGTVAFPVRTCASLLLTILISYFMWRERISEKEFAGLLVAIAAIVLMTSSLH